jgi:hypothetical protein
VLLSLTYVALETLLASQSITAHKWGATDVFEDSIEDHRRLRITGEHVQMSGI